MSENLENTEKEFMEGESFSIFDIMPDEAFKFMQGNFLKLTGFLPLLHKAHQFYSMPKKTDDEDGIMYTVVVKKDTWIIYQSGFKVQEDKKILLTSTKGKWDLVAEVKKRVGDMDTTKPTTDLLSENEKLQEELRKAKETGNFEQLDGRLDTRPGTTGQGQDNV